MLCVRGCWGKAPVEYLFKPFTNGALREALKIAVGEFS